MKITIPLLFSIFVLLLSGCSQSPQGIDAPVDRISSTNTHQQAEEAIPTPTILSEPSIPFPVPILSPSQQDSLRELLRSENCRMPCYLDVEPGKTKFEEAERKFEQIGMALRHDYPNYLEGHEEIPPLRVSTYIYSFGRFDTQNISLSGGENVIQQIQTTLPFSRTWRRYSVESILSEYGQPDEVLVYTHYLSHAVRVLYLEDGIVVEWTGTHKQFAAEYEICLQFTEENISWLEIITSDSRATLEADAANFMGVPGIRRPITEVLGIDEAEFYNRIISDPTSCFHVQEISP